MYIYIHTHIVVLMVEFTYWGFGLHHSEAHSLIGQRCTQWTGVHPHVQRRRPLHWQKDVFRGLAGVVAPRLGANSFQWCPWKKIGCFVRCVLSELCNISCIFQNNSWAETCFPVALLSLYQLQCAFAMLFDILHGSIAEPQSERTKVDPANPQDKSRRNF